MNKFEVIYKHGQFIDKVSGKRIIPVQDQEYLIIGDNSSFREEDPGFHAEALLDEEKKAVQVEKDYGQGNYVKILNSGDILSFRLGNSKMKKGEATRVYYFTCTLLEDLYLYKLRNRKGDKESDWRLADCQCELAECTYGGLILHEKVRSPSLNSLFCNTVMYYFPLQRSGSINVFSTFYIDPSPKKLILPSIPEREYSNLDSIRLQIVKSEKNRSN
jgi:hypothetical protein